MIARVNMADGGGRELFEELLHDRVQSKVSFFLKKKNPLNSFLQYGIIQAATLKRVKNHTTIPVPEVYAYDPCPNN